MQQVAENLSCEARRATHLIIWTDCDREGLSRGLSKITYMNGNAHYQLEILTLRTLQLIL
jgi:DNA topoisomerase IA